MTRIRIVEEKLTDNSVAYNVDIDDLTFHAINEKHAEQFRDEIMAAIERHTVDTVREVDRHLAEA